VWLQPLGVGAAAFASLNGQFQCHPPQPVARVALSPVSLLKRGLEWISRPDSAVPDTAESEGCNDVAATRPPGRSSPWKRPWRGRCGVAAAVLLGARVGVIRVCSAGNRHGRRGEARGRSPVRGRAGRSVRLPVRPFNADKSSQARRYHGLPFRDPPRVARARTLSCPTEYSAEGCASRKKIRGVVARNALPGGEEVLPRMI